MNLKVNRLNASGTTYIEEKTVSDGDSEYVVQVIGFETYRNYTWLTHGFSTRYGGVSDGIYKSMNLSFSQGDDERCVLKNHGIMAKTMGVELADMVYSHQTHTTNVLRVTREHAGMGFTVTRNFHDVDGFVTDVPGLMLVTAYADCVPLYFADTRLHVIGLSHSGWRGTVNNMAQATVDKMSYEFGSRPCDIAAFIGPSICASCYEIGDDVARNFRDRYGAESEKILTKKEAASRRHS